MSTLHMNKDEREFYNEKLYTSRLIKFCYKKQCQGDNLTPEKIYALCRLTWNYTNWQNGTGYALWILWNKKGRIPYIEDPAELENYQIPVGEQVGSNLYILHSNWPKNKIKIACSM